MSIVPAEVIILLMCVYGGRGVIKKHKTKLCIKVFFVINLVSILAVALTSSIPSFTYICMGHTFELVIQMFDMF